MRRKKLIQRTILAVLGFGGLIFIGLVAYGLVAVFFSYPRETHSLEQYPKLRAQWDQDLVGHFPAEIPTSASLKKLSHFPGYLQAGAHIQLRLGLPADQMLGLYSRYATNRTKSIQGGNTNRHMNEKEGMPTALFKTGDDGNNSFPDDFEIMIFDSLLPESERPPGFYWNHGRSHGVAISTNRNEIVYWAEHW